MRYLTFEDYTKSGGALNEAEFERVIDRACGIVDGYTYGRLVSSSETSKMVRCCIRDICEYLSVNKSAGSGAITSVSQSAGGVSETQSFAVKSEEDKDAEIRHIIQDYLSCETDANGVPLLYRGVRI